MQSLQFSGLARSKDRMIEFVRIVGVLRKIRLQQRTGRLKYQYCLHLSHVSFREVEDGGVGGKRGRKLELVCILRQSQIPLPENKGPLLEHTISIKSRMFIRS